MPNNWKTYKLSELSELITKGTTPSTYGYKFTETGINYIKSDSTSYDGILDESVFVKISNEAHEKLKRSQLKENDILFSIAGAYLGKSGVVRESHLPANTNQANAIIRINQELVLSDYISLALRSPKLIHYVNASTGQSAQPNLNLTDLGNLEFKIPPLPEQKAIANILSAIDDKIENNLSINNTLEAMAMALYKHWFVGFGPFQEGEFIDSELGPIPKGWEVSSVYDIATYVNGAAFKSSDFTEDGLYVIKIAELKSGITGNTKKSKKKIKPELVLHDGAVLFSWSATLDVFLWDKGEALLNQHIFNVIPNGKLNIEILYFLLRDIIYHFQAIAASRATTMGHIKISHLKETLVAIPSIENQQSTNDKFSPIFNQILKNKIENQTLTKLRDTLLPKLISGEVRLKELQEQIETVL